MRITLPPCPKCTGQLHLEYPNDRLAILNVKPEAVCLQCGWRRGVLLRDADDSTAAPAMPGAPVVHQSRRAA